MFLKCGEIHINIDVGATYQFHQRIKQAPPLPCDCPNCNNYRIAIHHAKKETLSFLDSLGVDPEHPLVINSYRDELQPRVLDKYSVETLLVADIIGQPHHVGAMYTGHHDEIDLMVGDMLTPPFATLENRGILPPKWLSFTFEIHLPWLIDMQSDKNRIINL